MEFRTSYLAEEFGKGLNATEQDHWMAVRGLLFLWMGHARRGSDWFRDLSDAIVEVDRKLMLLGVNNPSQMPRTAPALWSHYYRVVSMQWVWLKSLAPDNWSR